MLRLTQHLHVRPDFTRADEEEDARHMTQVRVVGDAPLFAVVVDKDNGVAVFCAHVSGAIAIDAHDTEASTAIPTSSDTKVGAPSEIS